MRVPRLIRPSSQPSSIHDQQVTMHIVTGSGCNKHRGSADVGWSAPTAGGDSFKNLPGALFRAPVADRCVEHDALAAAAGRSRNRADVARDHRGGNHDGLHSSCAIKAHPCGHDGADQGGSLSNPCPAVSPLPFEGGIEGFVAYAGMRKGETILRASHWLNQPRS